MKYPYKKSALYIMLIFVIVFFSIMGFLFREFIIVIAAVAIILICASFAAFSEEYSGKYVQLSNDTVKLGSYNFRGKGRHDHPPPVTFEIKYENIWVLESKKLPLIGVWAINIDATGLHQTVILERSFVNYKEMVKNLCKKAKQHNPKVYIDPELKKYIEEL